MAEKYKRKHLNNLGELDKEQDKIRRTCRRMEDDWLSGIINPQQIALSIAGGLFSRGKKSQKKNKEKSWQQYTLHSSPSESKSPVIDVARNIIGNPSVKGFLKRTATSWLRWQAFNLAVYLGKKAYKSIKHKREKKKLEEELERLGRQSIKK